MLDIISMEQNAELNSEFQAMLSEYSRKPRNVKFWGGDHSAGLNNWVAEFGLLDMVLVELIRDWEVALTDQMPRYCYSLKQKISYGQMLLRCGCSPLSQVNPMLICHHLVNRSQWPNKISIPMCIYLNLCVSLSDQVPNGPARV